ncbi:hypothetical protein SAMN05444166_1881 [Singulisphaera sp. GP187]|uniref:hypothetical protein n=1 Tax=Singulisphaera sp. GP187 TaxID=1882752 RepID=UPI00092586CA|nr:hypothetical protein [Singulisphaera sp. GP187]SIN97860.1 hypothetical protein SAMN05444166_1881 [Singulisphaera sp. GP187]
MSIVAQQPPLSRKVRKACDPVPLSPLEHALTRVAWLLNRRGYRPVDVSAIILELRAAGTAECCGRISDFDRPHVEALLPWSIDWSDPKWGEPLSSPRV